MPVSTATVRILLVTLVIAATLVGRGDAQPEEKKKASDEEVTKLIGQLSSTNFKTRELASNRLKEIDEALPALQKLSNSSDLETKRRIAAIIAVIEDRQAEQFIKKATTEVNQDGIDLFIDRMVLEKGHATDARWKAAMGMVRALVKRAEKVGATPPDLLGQDIMAFPVTTALDKGFANKTRGLVAGSEKLNAFHGCVVLNSGTFEGINSTNQTILIINGDIKSLNSTTNSIIICNGTIKSFNHTKNCLVFCNGGIESMNSTEGNAIFVRGEFKRMNFGRNNVVEASKLGDGVHSGGGNIFLNLRALPRGDGDSLKMADPSVLGIFQYYHPERSGLSFQMVKGDARVDAVPEAKPFAKAGLMKDDLILAVDGTKFLAEEEFISLMRRSVVGGQALLKVQRGDRVLELKVKLGP